LGSVETFAGILLALSRQVISLDLQSYGRTADIDRALSYETISDDMPP
jgi:hypothetical protein